MIFKLIPLLVIISLKTTRCSLVIDSIAQKGVYLSDYCPNMKYCKEGSHVMCMYYDPNQTMGPRCSNAVNISITADLANQLLDVTNAIRSKIANGKETGENGILLPRGYGIFRLRWDNELATFAQVLANQCVLRHDLCRSTKRFPDPGQTVGLVRFSYPDWSKAKLNLSPGLNSDKLAYAITQSLKSWYEQKNKVTMEMLNKYPDWTLKPDNQGGKLYLEMIYGSTTHMGCGMSAYSEYSYYDNMRQHSYNSIQVVCNYSARPRKGSLTYKTKKPRSGTGFSEKCGCPKGSKEDTDCLCTEQKKVGPTRSQPQPCINGDTGGCEPTLVLLPIFTVEDAPPAKLYERAEQIKEPLRKFILQRLDNSTVPNPNQSMKVYNDGASENHLPAPDRHSLRTVFIPATSSEAAPLPSPVFSMISLPSFPILPPHPFVPTPPPPPPPSPPLPPPPPPRTYAPAPPLDEFTEILKTISHPEIAHSEVSHHEITRHEVAPPEEKNSRKSPRIQRPGPKVLPMTKKSSIFTRVAQFKLPSRKSMSSSSEPVKKDVTPRKDFSNLHKIVNDYLKRRPENRRAAANNQNEENKNETILNKAEHKVINYNQYLKTKVNDSNNDKDIDIKDDNDNKLMSLLDTLERKVKNIELGGSEKELFDARIKKIYGSVVGKPVELLTTIPPKENTSIELDIPEIDIGESKNDAKYESAHLNEDEKIHKSRKVIRYDNEVEKKLDQVNSYDYSDRKRPDKRTVNSDLKKNNDIDQKLSNNVDGKHNDDFDHKYNENYFDHKYVDENHKYVDSDHKYMDDSDHKYNENINRKYSENNLDRRYNSGQHKYDENLNRKYQSLLRNKYDDNTFPPRNRVKYKVNKDLTEFREYKPVPLSSVEVKEDIKYFDKYSDKDSKVGRGTLDRTSYRNKDSDRKHKKRGDGRYKNRHAYNEGNEPLSVERRKYYQEKLDNIERKLRGPRMYRRRSEQRNDRQMRRMRPNRDGVQRSRLNPQVDTYYQPERARFLQYGF